MWLEFEQFAFTVILVMTFLMIILATTILGPEFLEACRRPSQLRANRYSPSYRYGTFQEGLAQLEREARRSMYYPAERYYYHDSEWSSVRLPQSASSLDIIAEDDMPGSSVWTAPSRDRARHADDFSRVEVSPRARKPLLDPRLEGSRRSASLITGLIGTALAGAVGIETPSSRSQEQRLFSESEYPKSV